MINVDKREISDFVSNAMLEYAREVNLRRAIPDYRDGLKPVQRVVLWQMFKSKLWHNAKHMKLAKLSGLCMTFHPHGDGSISGAAVNMSQEWSERTPLVDIQGNNGSIDGSGSAADRYIEARMTPSAELLLESIDENAVDIVDNYDGTDKIAAILPAQYPVMMTNGASGIGYGAATNILPHNPCEIIELMLLSLDKRLTFDEAVKVYHGPDFPTGGRIIGDYQQELTSAKATYTVSSNIEITDNSLVITSVPYGTSTTALIESIVKTLESHNVAAVADVFDNTEGENVNILITFKRGTQKQVIESTRTLLDHYSAATCKLSSNNVCVLEDGQKIGSVTLLEYIQMFTKFRLDTLQRVYAFRRDEATRKLRYVLAEIAAIENIEIVKDAIAKASSKNELENMLCEMFDDLDTDQAKHIAAMSLSSLVRSHERMSKLYSQRETLIDRFENNKRLCEDEQYARDTLSNELRELLAVMREHFPRKTTVGHSVTDKPVIDAVKTVSAAEKVCVSFSRHDSEITVSKNDPNNDAFISVPCMSDDIVLAFTDGGHVLQMHAGDFAPGRANRAYKNMRPGEKFIHACLLDKNMKLLVLTNRGYMKHSRITHCVPAQLTTRNSRIAHSYAGLKGGTDTVHWLGVYTDEHVTSITVQVDSNYKRNKIQQVELGSLLDRNDGGGSSGARYVNTKDGVWPITAVIMRTSEG